MLTWREQLQTQDEVISWAQAHQGGLSEATWRWRLARGRWQSPLRGVAVAHSGPPTERQLLWAAALFAGTSARLAGDAALAAVGHGPSNLRRVDVVVPHERQVVDGALPDRRRVQVRRVRGLDDLLDGSADHPPRLSVHVAVLQAAAWAESDRAAESRVAAAVQQRITAVPLLRSSLELLPRLPRRALVRRVLQDVELGAHALTELDFLRFCRKHDLPLPDDHQLKVRTGTGTRYLDARYVRQRVTVEVDGAHHRDAQQWEADALRALEVAVALPGERLVRVTPSMMRHEGVRTAELLRQLLG